MNVEPKQATTDDPELAKVLANNEDQSKNDTDGTVPSGLQFEETPIGTDPTGLPMPTSDDPLVNAATDLAQPTAVEMQAMPAPYAAPTTTVAPAALPGDLEGIKKEALGELRPLVEKLTLPADEKFDIMLLIIRSTDDHSLLATAHEAAKNIEDETRRAQALLDIVKEIDYFASQQAA